jgi:hypothetical protein
MAAVSDNDSPCFLADLPEEFNFAIIKELDMASCIALSRTSKQFQRLANPAEVSRRNKLQHFLVRARSLPQWRDGFACFWCAKVFPHGNFTSAQTRGTRDREGSVAEQSLRFCVQCGEYGLVSKLEIRWCKSMEYGSCAGAAEDHEVAGSMSDA